MALFFWAPLLFNRIGAATEPDIITIVLVEFALTWLASYKALAWACGRGPLARPWSLPQFCAVLLAPITPVAAGTAAAPAPRRGRQGEHAGGAGAMAGAFAAKVALMAVGIAVLRTNPPLLVVDLLYTLGLYAILSFTMDGPAAGLSAAIGMAVAPHFDEPYLSTSLADFWSRRWDLAAGNALRMVVFEPIMEGRLVHVETSKQAAAEQRQAPSAPAHSAAGAVQARRRRRLLATTACFLVSGAMHELQFVYMTGRWSRGLMLAFFLAQVPMLSLERSLAAALGRTGIRVPAPLRTLATLGSLLLLSHWTFWAAAHRWGVTTASLHSAGGAAPAALYHRHNPFNLSVYPREGEELPGVQQIMESMDEMDEQRKKSERGYEEAKSAALKLLASRPHSRKELKAKLRERGFELHDVRGALDRLAAVGLQSDAEFADTFARSKWRQSKWGPRRIEGELHHRGVSVELATAAINAVFGEGLNLRQHLEQLEEEEEEALSSYAAGPEQQLLEDARRQWARMERLPEDARRRRLVAWLQRRGHRWDDIRGLLHQLEKEDARHALDGTVDDA
ncbi:hypothetical protein ABPG75_008934 [Micractinium tetrahymenae]